MNVFIQCHNCGDQNCIEDIPALRIDLALFRGSEETVKCKDCGAEMNPRKAYCGIRVGEKVVPCADPKYDGPLP